MKDQLYIMSEEKISKALPILTLPAILSSLVTIIFNIVDTYYISLLNDGAMIAATTVALPIAMLIQSFGDGIAVGSGTYVSKKLGEKNHEYAYRGLITAMTFTFLLGLIINIIFLIFLRDILPLFNIEQNVINYAYDYMFIILLGGLGIIFKQVLVYLLRCQGIVRWPMISVFSGIAINIILDPLLMFTFSLNIKGAALASTIAEIVTIGMMLIKLADKSNVLTWNIKDIYIDFAVLKQIISIGFAAFVRNMLPSFSLTFLIRAAALYNTSLVAAMGVAKKSLRIITAVFAGYSQGLQPFTAYNYGAKNSKRITQALKTSLIFVVSIGLFASIVFWFKGSSITSLFGKDKDIIYYSHQMLKGYALSIPVLGIYHLGTTTLQALGEGKKSFFLSISRQGLFYIPIVLLLPPLIHELGIYLVQPLSDWLSFILLLFLARDLPEKINWQKGENHA